VDRKSGSHAWTKTAKKDKNQPFTENDVEEEEQYGEIIRKIKKVKPSRKWPITEKSSVTEDVFGHVWEGCELHS
jgi:hypothetical protein